MVSLLLLSTPQLDANSKLQSRCLRVCKNWKSVLNGKEAKELWRVQHYQWETGGPKHKVSHKSLMRYAFFAGHQVTSLSIENSKYFGLNNYTLGVILARCNQLKHLKIRGGGGTPTVLDASQSTPLPSLETIYPGLGVRISGGLLRRLAHASPDIKELSIFDLGGDNVVKFNDWPILHKLSTIRLANSKDGVLVDIVCVLGSPIIPLGVSC